MASKRGTPRKLEPPVEGIKPASAVNDEQAASSASVPALPFESGIRPGSVDVTGIVPEDVHVDPDILEGHPGYEESGGSEFVLKGLSKGKGPAND
jgi:hypothetical protein